MELVTRQTSLSANIVGLCRFLRKQGFRLGPNDYMDAMKALEVVPFRDQDTMQKVMKAILTRSVGEQMVFDELYQQYWRELEKASDAKQKEEEKPTKESNSGSSANKNNLPTVQSLKSWVNGEKSAEDTLETATYSAGKVKSMQDFSTFTDEELHEVTQLVSMMGKTLARRSQRRYRNTRQQRNFDVKQTIRKNMRRGGEIVELAYKRKKIRNLKLVMLCDVSKSMDLYSRFLVQFIYAFQSVYKRIETFVFSTSLYHVSGSLQHRDFSVALEEISRKVDGWSGGTRIGESFQQFCREYGNRMLDGRTIVLVISDGWDTGDTDILEESMEFIHKRSGGVIWLNPLAGNEDYTPSVKGMEAAMPFIDVFAPAHNLDSLRNILAHIKHLKKK